MTAANTHWAGGAVCVSSKAKVNSGDIVLNPEKGKQFVQRVHEELEDCRKANTRLSPTPSYHQAGQGQQQCCWVVGGHEGSHPTHTKTHREQICACRQQ